MPEPAIASGDIAMRSAEEGKANNVQRSHFVNMHPQSSPAYPQLAGAKVQMEPEQLASEWQHVLGNLQKKDNAMIKDFNEEIDTLLVFAGLFSAVLTTFIIEVYKRLEQDQTETSAILLRRISMQLDQEARQAPISLPSSIFHPSNLIVAVNVLWFMSLLFSLFAALVAILAKQWIHVYSKWDEGPSDLSKNKLFLRDLYQQGLARYHIPEIIGMLPVLLQVSLFWFIIGLTMFLWYLKLTVLAATVSSISAVGISFALYTIIRPIFDRKCMYKTPLAIFAAGAWESLVGLKSPLNATGLQENTSGRSYTRWRDHDLLLAKRLHRYQSTAEGILAQISLVFDIRPPITWATLKDGTAISGMLELDATTSSLVKKLMISLLYAADKENRYFFLHKSSAPLYYVFQRGFPPPSLKLLDDNFRSSLPDQEATLERDFNITLALVEHINAIPVVYPADKDTVLWGLHLLCFQLETLIVEYISGKAGKNVVERIRSSSSPIWLTFEKWLQPALMFASQDPAFIKPQETLLLDCFSENYSIKDIKLIVDAVMNLEKIFPDTAKLNAAILWRLRLLNETTDIIVRDGQDTFSKNSIFELQALASTLHHWIGIAANKDTKLRNSVLGSSAVFASSVTLLGALFDLIALSSEVPCSLEKLTYAPSSDVSLCLSLDGKKIATGDQNGVINVWDFTSRRIISSMHGHEELVISVSFSKDGTRVASCSYDDSTRIWSTETGEKLCTMVQLGHRRPVSQVVFSSGEADLICGSLDKTAIIWDCATGEVVHILTGHTDVVRSVAFSDDELRVATASDDNTVRIWDTNTGTCLNIVETKHSSGVSHVEFIKDSYDFFSSAFTIDLSSEWEQKCFRAAHHDSTQTLSELEDVDLSFTTQLVTFNPHTRYLLCWEPEVKQLRPILKLPDGVVTYPASHPFQSVRPESPSGWMLPTTLEENYVPSYLVSPQIEGSYMPNCSESPQMEGNDIPDYSESPQI